MVTEVFLGKCLVIVIYLSRHITRSFASRPLNPPRIQSRGSSPIANLISRNILAGRSSKHFASKLLHEYHLVRLALCSFKCWLEQIGYFKTLKWFCVVLIDLI